MQTVAAPRHIYSAFIVLTVAAPRHIYSAFIVLTVAVPRHAQPPPAPCASKHTTIPTSAPNAQSKKRSEIDSKNRHSHRPASSSQPSLLKSVFLIHTILIFHQKFIMFQ